MFLGELSHKSVFFVADILKNAFRKTVQILIQNLFFLWFAEGQNEHE